MLKRKRHEVGDKANKLKGGLQKLQETGVQVAEMQVSLAYLLSPSHPVIGAVTNGGSSDAASPSIAS